MDAFEYECGPKCHSKRHSSELNAVITQCSLVEIQAYFQLCHSAGHQSDLDGRTALHMASVCGKLDVVDWLLKEKKVNVNVADLESKWTALHKAMFYGHLAVARHLIQNSALLSPFDHEGLQALEVLLKDRPKSLTYTHQDSNEVFLWGENTNSTLGHSSEQRRLIPTPVDTFKRQNLSIKQVLLCKYHTVFLTQCGQFYTCGHGQGGRLGLNNENTYLIPQKGKTENCVQIAASINHTIILRDNGNVYTCGLNTHYQLGQVPPPSNCLSPKLISLKILNPFKGICAGQFHSVFHTKNEIYSVGLNGGQLGFPKSERYQVQLSVCPLFKPVTRILCNEGIQISQVACSDAATICLTDSGDIYVLHEFQCRKIKSNWSKILKIEVTGGNLDLNPETSSSSSSTVDKNANINATGTPLVIMVLSQDGRIFLWRSLSPIFCCCLFNIRNLDISDICLGDSHFVFVTKDGRAFNGMLKTGRKFFKDKISSKKEEENPFHHITKRKTVEREEIEELEVSRIPYIHRASSIAINREGNNFAITQVDPLKSIDTSYDDNTSNISVDLKDLLESHWYDLQIQFGQQQQLWPSYRYILAHHSNYFRRLLLKSESIKSRTSDLIISLGYIHIDLIKQLFKFFYTNTCHLTTPGCKFKWTTKQKNYIDFDFYKIKNPSNEKSLQTSALADTIKSNSVNNLSANLEEEETPSKCPVSLLLAVADTLEIEELSTRLKKVYFAKKMVKIKYLGNRKRELRFDQQELPELSDIKIKSEDGIEFKCHRCILIASSEYFYCMLTNDWLEASFSKGLSFPFPSDVVSVLIEFLYTNQVSNSLVTKNLDFFCEILVLADQILLTKLKDIAERHIITSINLKNVGELLEFSFLYNAKNLKKKCLQFICNNLAFLLESRFLDIVSDQVIEELSKFYRKMIDSSSRRLVTPFTSSGLDQSYLSSLVSRLRNSKQAGIVKSEPVLKQKSLKRRPRTKTKSLSDDDFMQINRSLLTEDASVGGDLHRNNQNHNSSNNNQNHNKQNHNNRSLLTEDASVGGDPHRNNQNHNNTNNHNNNNNIFLAKEKEEKVVILKREKHERSPEKIDNISGSNRFPQVKRDKGNPWNLLTSPIKIENQVKDRSKQSPENLFYPSKIVNLTDIMAEQNSLTPHDFSNNNSNFQSFSRSKKTLRKNAAKSPPPLPTASIQSPPPSPARPNNPWLKPKNLNEPQETIPVQPNISEIIQDEMLKVKNNMRISKKPLKFIQIEEKAIEELLCHYSCEYSFDEKITIDRETLKQAQPIWGRKKTLFFPS